MSHVTGCGGHVMGCGCHVTGCGGHVTRIQGEEGVGIGVRRKHEKYETEKNRGKAKHETEEGEVKGER